MGIIYALHLGDGNYRYVGATIRAPKKRLMAHLRGLGWNDFDTWKRENLNNVQIQVLEHSVPSSSLACREQWWIKRLLASDYELLNKSTSPYPEYKIGSTHNDATKDKLRLASKTSKRVLDGRKKQANALRGRPKSPEHRAKLDVANKRKANDPKFKARMKEIANNPSDKQLAVRANVNNAYAEWAEANKEEAFQARSKAGKEGSSKTNHVRWHERRGITKSDCPHCI